MMKLACQLNDILPGTIVCALIEGRQIALFRPSAAAEVFAIDNRDPFFAANVLSRGLICRTRRRALGRQPAQEAALSPERWPLFRQPCDVGAELPR
jgi:hypothetical protein